MELEMKKKVLIILSYILYLTLLLEGFSALRFFVSVYKKKKDGFSDLNLKTLQVVEAATFLKIIILSIVVFYLIYLLLNFKKKAMQIILGVLFLLYFIIELYFNVNIYNWRFNFIDYFNAIFYLIYFFVFSLFEDSFFLNIKTPIINEGIRKLFKGGAIFLMVISFVLGLSFYFWAFIY